MTARARLVVGIWVVLLSMQPLSGETGKAGKGFKLVEIKVGYEARHDRFRFNFHNPSSFNTAAPVPHQFVQTYTADNHWGIVKANYLLLRIPWESEFGMTPQRTNYGDDYDTFYQPDGDVVVSGTTGNVSMREFSFAQRAWLGQLKGFSLGTGYQYLRVRSRFQFGNSFETHTKPPSGIFEKLPIQETTRSRVHEFYAAARREWHLTPRSFFSAELRYAPVAAAFLTTILPAKYPGEEINFLAKSTGLCARLALRVLTHSLPLEFFADYGRYWSYRQSEFRREAFALGMQVGWSAHP